MDKTYYDTATKLEQLGVDREYIEGWMSGYLGNPKREEQRLTEPYEAGYEDGLERTTDHAEDWIKK
jgi:hypothetical protein